MNFTEAPFEPPTNHYHQALTSLDETLSRLWIERLETSGNNPGFPPVPLIETWAAALGTDPEPLKRFFATLYFLSIPRPRPVTPEDFRQVVPIGKFKVIPGTDAVLTILNSRQYANASVLHVSMDWSSQQSVVHPDMTLDLGEDYTVTRGNGSGNGNSFQHMFVVTPPIPDDLMGVTFQLHLDKGRAHSAIHRSEQVHVVTESVTIAMD